MHPTVVVDDSASRVFTVRPRGVREAIARALVNEEREVAESRWYDAFSSGGASHGSEGAHFNAVSPTCARRSWTRRPTAFRPIRRIGGDTGWYAYDWLWKLRGALDLLAGGVGVRRGRPSPDQLRVGDALDFWRVESFEPDRVLRLRAEMKLPGRAWLEFEVAPLAGGRSEIRQTALYDPVGLLGLAYWYAILPLHRVVFRAMLEGVASAVDSSRDGSVKPRDGANAT
ncbi:MAG: DUF2867 domain-containing protein [Planctomycetota bacterium]